MRTYQLDFNRLRIHIQFLGDQGGKTGGYALSHFISGAVEPDAIVRRDMHECIRREGAGQYLERVARPPLVPGEPNRQTTAGQSRGDQKPAPADALLIQASAAVGFSPAALRSRETANTACLILR